MANFSQTAKTLFVLMSIIINLVLGAYVSLEYFLGDIVESVCFKSTSGDRLYLKMFTPGFGDNSARMIVSRYNKKYYEIDTSTDIYFGGYDPIYYSFESDTLWIFYTRIISMPPGFRSNINVQLVISSVAETERLRQLQGAAKISRLGGD